MQQAMNKIIVLLLMALQAQICLAQITDIQGKVSDKHGNAISMATVTAKDDEGKVIAGCFSDSDGCFHITVTEKARELSVSCVGYNDYHSALDTTGRLIVFNVPLEAAVNGLGEVTVTSRKPLITRKADRIILNAERLNAAATNFLDVLKCAPGIIVQDDDISMLNKGRIIVLMNGRELKMDMKALCVYLTTLSPDKLKQVEVMTMPPAKYSAEGNTGIINLVTKKIKNDYLGGYVSNRLSIKEHVYDGVSLSAEYKHDKIEAYANAGLGIGTMQMNNVDRISYPGENWNTDNRKLKSNDYALATAGMDYGLTKNSSLGFILSYSNMQPDTKSLSNTLIRNKADNEQTGHFQTATNFECDYNRWNSNMHYNLENIGRDGVLSVDMDYLKYNIKDHVSLQSAYDETLNYSNFPKTEISIYQVKADLKMPIGNAVLSYGNAYSISKTDNLTNYEYMNADYDLNDHFVYRENIFATYVDMKYKFSERLETKVGLRGEYCKSDGNSLKLNSRKVKRQFDLFPTAYLNYNWNDENSVSLSVSGRINRPSYVDINPFATYTDAHTIQKGNPNLLPEKSYSAEVGYTYKDFSVSASVLRRTRVISAYTSIDQVKKDITVTTDNVMTKHMWSLDSSYYLDKTSWFDFSVDGSIYLIKSKHAQGYDMKNVSQVSTFLYVNNNFYLNKKKTFVVNLWGQYQGKEKDVVGASAPRYRVDVALKYLLLNKRMSIGMEFQNMLSSHSKSTVEMNGASYTCDGKPYRVLNLSLSYRLGKTLNVKRKDFGIDTNRL